MLSELVVTNLGVISQAKLLLSGSMTALTGETGAGKTMIVQAVQLLIGGRADASMVRTGETEAVVEGRFVRDTANTKATAMDGDAEPGDEPSEVILTRVVSVTGRSRAYVNGSMATIARLAELGTELIDLHGQNQHQSLLAARTQREALDTHASIDLTPLHTARAELARLRSELAGLGGDAAARAQETDLLRYQADEIEALAITGVDELETLAEREEVLADATAHIEAGHAVRAALIVDPAGSDNTAIDKLGVVLSELSGRLPFKAIRERLASAHAELSDIAAELRNLVDGLEQNPRELEAIRARRQLLIDMTRKYGGTLTDVVSFAERSHNRLSQLEHHDRVATELESAIATATDTVAATAREVAVERRAAAPLLAEQVSALLPSLAMRDARLTVNVGGADPADEVQMCIEAGRGLTSGPLDKIASGGELARIMLALRLVLTAGPPTLVFDEVDAGIGGEAAMAVGRSLARLSPEHQVLVVTHLPQVSAFADQQIAVRKTDDGTTVATDVVPLDGEARVAELTRMLAGMPESTSGRTHAAELLAAAAAELGTRSDVRPDIKS